MTTVEVADCQEPLDVLFDAKYAYTGGVDTYPLSNARISIDTDDPAGSK